MLNISLFVVPAYWVLTMLPHQYVITIITKANNGRWENSNPRSSNWDATLRQSIPAEIYGRYERAEAAHKNGFENLPIFVGAILAGNIAHLSSPILNAFVAIYIFLRILFTGVYISVTQNRTSFLRTVIWFVSTMPCMAIFIRAGIALA